VETYAWISRQGVEPLVIGSLPPVWLKFYGGQRRAGIDRVRRAARDRRLALQALLADALVKDWTVAQAMLDDLVEANAAHLPQF